MFKLHKYIILLITLTLIITACESAEQKVMKENRKFIDTQYTQLIFEESFFNNSPDNFVKENKNNFVRWTAHIKELESNDKITLQEEGLPKINASFEYKVNKDKKYKVGDLITISGKIDTYVHSLFGTIPHWDLENCRIETTTEEDKNMVATFNMKKNDEVKVMAEAEAKKKDEKEEAERKAKEEANKVINSDFKSFEEPYKKMTNVQKENFFKSVKGRYVQWTGTVVDVNKDIIFVKCLPDSFTSDFMAFTASSEKNKLVNIPKGSRITIKGILSEREGDVIATWVLEGCIIVSN